MEAKMRLGLCAFFLSALLATPAHAVRLKELVDVEGFRGNALVGVGVVVGLAGTGDDVGSLSTQRPLSTLLRRLGTFIDYTEIKARNVALVTVTATLPAFSRPGAAIDITVSSMGTAKSLQGGTLIATPLKGPDGETYAVAQGSLTVGGFAVGGSSGSSTKRNHVNAGHVPAGATVERGAPSQQLKNQVVLLLKDADFTTATRIAASVDAALGAGSAKVRDPGAVLVKISDDWKDKPVELIAKLEVLDATPDAPGRVIIDERTGTLVVGASVALLPAAIAHGGLTVHVDEQKVVSQPNALGQGQTVALPTTNIEVDEDKGQLIALGAAGTVGDVAAALNALGAKPRDLISIFQALKAAGALRAEVLTR
jgi:flagellar P-ring protein precursor FlgI